MLAAGFGGQGHAPGGTWAQPAASRIAATRTEAGRAMWVVILEMAVALALLALIVWWTWPKKPRDGGRED